MRESFTAILETLGGTISTPARRKRTRRGAGPTGPTGPVVRDGMTVRQRQYTGHDGAYGCCLDSRPQLGAGGGIIHEVGCEDGHGAGEQCGEPVLPGAQRAERVLGRRRAVCESRDKNPTHTIIALAWRTAEYLAEEMRKGNV